MEKITLKQLAEQTKAILEKNGRNPSCFLIGSSLFTHSDGEQSYTFSITTDKSFVGDSPESCLAQLNAHYMPKFDGDVELQ